MLDIFVSLRYCFLQCPVNIKFSKLSFLVMCPRNFNSHSDFNKCSSSSHFLNVAHVFYLWYSQHPSIELHCFDSFLHLQGNRPVFTAIREDRHWTAIQHSFLCNWEATFTISLHTFEFLRHIFHWLKNVLSICIFFSFIFFSGIK